MRTELKEALDVKFDKLRQVGTLNGGQRIIYTYVTDRAGRRLLEKLFTTTDKIIQDLLKKGHDYEGLKDALKLALIDVVDSRQ